MKTKNYILLFACTLTFLFLSVQATHAQSDSIEYGDDSIPRYYKNQFIVKFHPDVMNLDIIDSIEYQSGTLESFIKPEALEVLIDSNWYDVDLANLTVHKVYTNLTSQITYSISRLGDTVEMPKLWSTLLIEWPSDAATDEEETVDSLNKLTPIVEHASLNRVVRLMASANDAMYSDQASIHSISPNTNAHINIEPAWDVETGKSHIRVGVYDNVIFWGHEDFGNGTFSGSIVKGGWNYALNQSISSTTHVPISALGNHGTKVAGIIGAIRNNNMGVAGIAGGNSAGSLSGVGLWSMATHGADADVGLGSIANAIVEGVSYNPSQNYGFGYHIINCSWGSFLEEFEEDLVVLRDASYQSYINACVMVASRGNTADDEFVAPACFEDDWVISVGGSGTDGGYASAGAGGSLGAAYGRNMDIIGPYNSTLCKTTMDDIVDGQDYGTFGGTSAAAAHTSGVSALILSQQNTSSINHPANLAPEDVEYLIQKYATDIKGPAFPQPTGYDDETGWGRINAGTTLQMADKPGYYISHTHNNPVSTTSNLLFGNVWMTLKKNTGILPAGRYRGKLYKLTQSYSITVSSNLDIMGVWARGSSSFGNDGRSYQYGYDNFAKHENVSIYNSNHSVDFDVYTYYWLLEEDAFGRTINKYYPADPNTMNTAYSLHLHDLTVTGLNREKENIYNFTVYPNPSTTGEAYLSFYSPENGKIDITISDITGKTIKQLNLENEIGSLLLKISTEEFSQGVYMIKFKAGDFSITKKLVVTNK